MTTPMKIIPAVFDERESQLVTDCHRFKLPTDDGKTRLTKEGHPVGYKLSPTEIARASQRQTNQRRKR